MRTVWIKPSSSKLWRRAPYNSFLDSTGGLDHDIELIINQSLLSYHVTKPIRIQSYQCRKNCDALSIAHGSWVMNILLGANLSLLNEYYGYSLLVVMVRRDWMMPHIYWIWCRIVSWLFYSAIIIVNFNLLFPS
jgi:hypothetical protein